MTKLILLALIIMLAFWLGKMSVSKKRISSSERKKEFKSPVIDITPEDK